MTQVTLPDLPKSGAKYGEFQKWWEITQFYVDDTIIQLQRKIAPGKVDVTLRETCPPCKHENSDACELCPCPKRFAASDCPCPVVASLNAVANATPTPAPPDALRTIDGLRILRGCILDVTRNDDVEFSDTTTEETEYSFLKYKKSLLSALFQMVYKFFYMNKLEAGVGFGLNTEEVEIVISELSNSLHTKRYLGKFNATAMDMGTFYQLVDPYAKRDAHMYSRSKVRNLWAFLLGANNRRIETHKINVSVKTLLLAEIQQKLKHDDDTKERTKSLLMYLAFLDSHPYVQKAKESASNVCVCKARNFICDSIRTNQEYFMIWKRENKIFDSDANTKLKNLNSELGELRAEMGEPDHWFTWYGENNTPKRLTRASRSTERPERPTGGTPAQYKVLNETLLTFGDFLLRLQNERLKGELALQPLPELDENKNLHAPWDIYKPPEHTVIAITQRQGVAPPRKTDMDIEDAKGGIHLHTAL